MSLFTHGHNCIVDSDGDCLVIAELIESVRFPLCFSQNNRYRMVLNSRDLCRILATGYIFIFSGVFPLISPYRTTLAYPFLIFSAVSACRATVATNEFSEGCGPQRRVASIWSVDHSRSKFSGKPSVA